MADCIDPVLQPMQALDRQPVVDRVLTDPKRPQLPAPHHPMLPPRQLRDLRVRFARPSQPAYIAGWDGLGG